MGPIDQFITDGFIRLDDALSTQAFGPCRDQ
jgi:hypothetical protein